MLRAHPDMDLWTRVSLPHARWLLIIHSATCKCAWERRQGSRTSLDKEAQVFLACLSSLCSPLSCIIATHNERDGQVFLACLSSLCSPLPCIIATHRSMDNAPLRFVHLVNKECNMGETAQATCHNLAHTSVLMSLPNVYICRSLASLVCLSVSLAVYLSVCLSVCLSVRPSVRLSAFVCLCLSLSCQLCP